MAEYLFWTAFLLMLYSYAGYPVVLRIAGLFLDHRWLGTQDSIPPRVSIIVPVHNEEGFIGAKLENLLAISYPKDRLEIVVVSDACRDRTTEIVRTFEERGVQLLELPQREGKAAALNLGLTRASGEIVIFTDAAILLEPEALKELVLPFQHPSVGCVSGEDSIPGQSGEGLYGRYEIYLRNQESRIGSIVGASGCFYGQRRELVPVFKPGMPPDFVSVLETVSRGYRAVTQPSARGVMGSVSSTRGEFQRKCRTLLRGITALMVYPHLLNPRRFGIFAFSLWSHKILRWLGGVLMVAIFLANLALWSRPFYAATLVMQAGFYGAALVGVLRGPAYRERLFVKIPLFFCTTNLATLLAWGRYMLGHRQEIWEPSRRN